MNVQREVASVIGPKMPECACGKNAKLYITNGIYYHLECNPCQHATVRLSSVVAAAQEFSRMMEVKKQDMQARAAA